MRTAEFSAPDLYLFDRRSVDRWIVSHLWRYRWRLLLVVSMYLISAFSFSAAPVLIGGAVATMLSSGDMATLTLLTLGVLSALVADGGFNLVGAMQWEFVAKRFSADARGELYASLLEKNQVFHNRQRAGDLMARATDDVGGSLLDNTMLVYGAGISDGNRHNHDDLPILLAGGGGGAIKTGGQHVVYPQNTPMTNLFLSMLDRVGVRVEKLGDSTGKLNGLF